MAQNKSTFQQLSGIELKKIENELQFLVNGKVDKIYMLDKKDLLFNIHKTGIGKVSVRVFLPNVIYVTSKKYDSPTKPPGFCTFLRKYLGNSRLRKIEMVNSERILNLEFETKDEKFHLFLEFFDKGNAIMTDENLIIKSPLETQIWKDRTIRGGIKYEFPKKDYDLFKLTKEEFFKLVDTNTNKKIEISKFLSMLGFGKDYSEEILKKVKLDAKKIVLNEKEKTDVFNTINKFLKNDFKPVVSNKKAYLTKKNKDDKIFETFSGALDYLIEPIKKKIENKNEKKITKIEKIIEAQSKRKKTLLTESVEKQKKGEIIYENYLLIKDILENINKAKKKFKPEEIKNKLKDHEIIKDIDLSTGKITLEINDV